MNFEELILKNIVWIIGILVHAIWTYWKVGELDKKTTALEVKINEEVKALTKENSELIAEISKLREMVSNMDAKLDILLKGYTKEKK